MSKPTGPYANLNTSRPEIIRRYGGTTFKGNPRTPTEVAFNLNSQGKVHPDGHAWAKCCCGDRDISPGQVINCAFIDKRIRAKNPQYDGLPFVCVHRVTEDGYVRVCAGWDKCYGKGYKP
jgi:hypothetical protein